MGLRGGSDVPALIRKIEPNRCAFSCRTAGTISNNHGGNWYLANLEMLSALEFAGYEVKHAWGDGAHAGKHAPQSFPTRCGGCGKDIRPQTLPPATRSSR